MSTGFVFALTGSILFAAGVAGVVLGQLPVGQWRYLGLTERF